MNPRNGCAQTFGLQGGGLGGGYLSEPPRRLGLWPRRTMYACRHAWMDGCTCTYLLSIRLWGSTADARLGCLEKMTEFVPKLASLGFPAAHGTMAMAAVPGSSASCAALSGQFGHGRAATAMPRVPSHKLRRFPLVLASVPLRSRRRLQGLFVSREQRHVRLGSGGCQMR